MSDVTFTIDLMALLNRISELEKANADLRAQMIARTDELESNINDLWGRTPTLVAGGLEFIVTDEENNDSKAIVPLRQEAA